MILIILAVVVLTIFGIVAFAASRGAKAPQAPSQRMPEPWPVPTAPKVTLSPVVAPVAPDDDLTVTPQVETNWQREVDPGAGRAKL